MNHFPFDDGRLADLSKLVGQKTIKAYCKRRVPLVDADYQQHVDCPDCRRLLEKRRDDDQSLLDAIDRGDCADMDCTSLRESCVRHVTWINAVLAA